MTFIEFIGFIISLAAMFFIVGKKMWDESRRRKNPEKYAEEERKKEAALKNLMKSLNMEINEEREEEEEEFDDEEVIEELSNPPQFKPNNASQQKPEGERIGQQGRKFEFPDQLKSPLETRSLKLSISDSDRQGIINSAFRKSESSAYEIVNVKRVSRAAEIINQLPSLKHMAIIKEVFGPPMSMRQDPLAHDQFDK